MTLINGHYDYDDYLDIMKKTMIWALWSTQQFGHNDENNDLCIMIKETIWTQ